MSKKLKKFLNDAEKTESKIAELEEYLRNVRAAQKKEEDNEIVRAIRSTKPVLVLSSRPAGNSRRRG